MKLPNFDSAKVQIKMLAIAIFIVFLISVSGCSGNYSMGDSTKLYCSAVDIPSPTVKKAALSSGNGLTIAPVESPIDQ